MEHLLLIEDDLTYSKIIRRFLEKNGYLVSYTSKLKEGITLIQKEKIDLVITDYRLPDGTGMEVLEYVVATKSRIPVILITNYSDIRTAVRAIKIGAFEYITKPINPDELLLSIKEATKASSTDPKEQPSADTNTEEYFIGESEQALNLEKQINLVAPTDLSILVLGESGTGKEFISKRIHNKSLRKNHPFVAVDCGALSQELAGSELFGHVKGAFTGAVENKTGFFEAANKGTIFLDEIGNLSHDIQIKLLRAIQERKIRKVGDTKDIPIDVRIIAATNDNLRENASTGGFREDLYFRINEFSLTAMPLRERKQDFFALTSLFLKQSNTKLNRNVTGLSPEVEAAFLKYSWPGNLRELKNVIRRSVLLTNAGEIQKETLPEEIVHPQREINHEAFASADNLRSTFEEKEKELIIKTLEEARFNKSKTAAILKMDRKTLYKKMEKYDIR